MTLVTQDAPPVASGLPPTSTGRQRWTRDDCLFFEQVGRLTGRYELIDGEIIRKMSQNRSHAFVITRIFLFLASVFGGDQVQGQSTMEVFRDDQLTNRPEPDLVALREDIDDNPTGADVLLAVGVSSTTQANDLGFKVGLYARAGVSEYWVLDITRRVLTAYRHAENGLWREIVEYGEDSQLAPLSAPDASVRVGDFLRPASREGGK